MSIRLVGMLRTYVPFDHPLVGPLLMARAALKYSDRSEIRENRQRRCVLLLLLYVHFLGTLQFLQFLDQVHILSSVIVDILAVVSSFFFFFVMLFVVIFVIMPIERQMLLLLGILPEDFRHFRFRVRMLSCLMLADKRKVQSIVSDDGDVVEFITERHHRSSTCSRSTDNRNSEQVRLAHVSSSNEW